MANADQSEGMAKKIVGDLKEAAGKLTGDKETEAEGKAGTLKEIILAFSLNPNGDHTDSYIRELLDKKMEEHTLKISSLGRGLSTGTELEYSDQDTLKNALKNRQ